MDLLGRMMGMNKGAHFMNLLQEIQNVIGRAKETDGLSSLGEKLEGVVARLGETAMHLGSTAMSPEVKTAFAYAYPFLEVMGDVVMAWMLLWRAVVAAPKLNELLKDKTGADQQKAIEKNKHAAFYHGQLETAAYYIESILPVTLGKMDAIRATSKCIMDMPEACFGG
jgi:hypothetical protein